MLKPRLPGPCLATCLNVSVFVSVWLVSCRVIRRVLWQYSIPHLWIVYVLCSGLDIQRPHFLHRHQAYDWLTSEHVVGYHVGLHYTSNNFGKKCYGC